jgi:hypothetical protein
MVLRFDSGGYLNVRVLPDGRRVQVSQWVAAKVC